MNKFRLKRWMLHSSIGVVALIVVFAVVFQSNAQSSFWDNVAERVSVLLAGKVNAPAVSEDFSFGASGTRFPSGISADNTSPVAGQVRGTTLSITATSTFSGRLVTDLGHNRSYTNSSTTASTAHTLLESDILYYDSVMIDLTGGATTLTFPATSTLTAFIPAVGDMASQCWLPSTNNLIFAEGVGITLQTSSTTATDLTVEAGHLACLKYMRSTSTDIFILLTEGTDSTAN